MGAEYTAQLQATLAIDEIQDLLLQTGFNKPITSLTTGNKEEISRAIVDYHLMAKVKCIMDQFWVANKIQGTSNTLGAYVCILNCKWHY